ncbi:MAG: hypothetical protein HY680_07690 [Chloroflexi bacterium]|nr:hypothetical protein [Chloroflexota bacterium]
MAPKVVSTLLALGPLRPSLVARLGRLAREQSGGLMVETTIAVAIFVLAGGATMTGLSMTHRSGATIREQSLAENIARNQMESIFNLPYQAPPSTYPSVATPPGYSVAALAESHVEGDVNIEKVTITVAHAGAGVLVLETLRVR